MNDVQATAMAPQPFPPLPGVSVAFVLSDLVELGKALDAMGKRASGMSHLSWVEWVTSLLVAGDPAVVIAAAKLGLKNPDSTRFAGNVDTVDASAIELGRALADGVWRRSFGDPLPQADDVEVRADD